MATFNGIEITYKLRPCIVDGNKALFHRLGTDEGIVVKANTYMKPADFCSWTYEVKKELSDKNNVLPAGCELHKCSKTFALVEYEDGVMERVQPELVRFIDSQELMAEIAWPEEV